MAQVSEYKPCTRPGRRRLTLVGPLLRDQSEFVIVKLYFDQVSTILLSMLHDNWKELPPQWVRGMRDTHTRGMCFYMCFW